jgi:prepilin-type N-terminal cleavage/methylation domain-containing protein
MSDAGKANALRGRRKHTDPQHDMKTPRHTHATRTSGFTLIELLVVISIIAIIAGLAFPAFATILRKARMGDQMSNGRQIYIAMRGYASETSHGGRFPMYKDPDDANTMVNTSNEAFEILLPKYLDNKAIFANKGSAYCKPQPKTPENANKVLSGESDWVYVRGLGDASNSQWPLLANAFTPGTTTYGKDESQKGGVWKGSDAVVIWASGSAEIAPTKEQSATFFVKRADKPTANAFEPDEGWLSGEDVKVLEPK